MSFPDLNNPSYQPNPPYGGPPKPTGMLPSHRGALVLALGIPALVFGLVAPFPFCCSSAVTAGLGMVGVIFGGISGFLGMNDLKAMDAGQMDPEGRGLTMTGMILGWVGLGLGAIWMVIGMIFVVMWLVLVIGSSVSR